jgi:alanine racemase
VAPILVLSEPGSDDALEPMLRAGVDVTAYTPDFIRMLSTEAERLGVNVSVHVKVDTGMGRVGVSPLEAVEICGLVQSCKMLELKGVYTHFAMADAPEDSYTGEQIHLFERVLNDLKLASIHPPLVHAANSAAARNFLKSHYQMIRVGLDMYDEVLTFNTMVTQVKRMPAGRRLSYNGIYTTPAATYIATLSAGYADGVDRLLSNRGRVLINGLSYPMVGRVTMDMLLVDLGPQPPAEVKRGAVAVLIGKSGAEHIRISEVASECGTIPYEIMCGIGKRVPRLYHKTNV